MRITLISFIKTLICASILTGVLFNSSSADEVGRSVAKDADRYIGNPYVFGGNSFSKGIDCSAFVKGLYKRKGYCLPRRAEWQVVDTVGCPTYHNYNEIRVGDTLYFAKNKGKGEIHHTAIVSDFSKGGIPIITHAKGKKFGIVKEAISKRYISEIVAIKRFSECASLLKGRADEREVASTILLIAKKYHLNAKELYATIEKISNLTPLILHLTTSKENTEALLASKEEGVEVMVDYSGDGLILKIESLAQAQYIAKNFYKSGFPFRAGITLVDSSLFSSKNITSIFYPLVNMEKNIQKIKSCFSTYGRADIRALCIKY